MKAADKGEKTCKNAPNEEDKNRLSDILRRLAISRERFY